MSDRTTNINLNTFDNYVKSMLPGIKRQYDRGVNRDLSQQRWQDLFKRNITTVLQAVYQDALAQLRLVSFEHDGMSNGEENSDISKRVLTPFPGLIDELIRYAVQKNRTSCALSNFPEEHNPNQAYLAQVLQDIELDWSGFVSQVSALLPR